MVDCCDLVLDRISGEISRKKGMERGVVAPQNDVLLAFVS